MTRPRRDVAKGSKPSACQQSQQPREHETRCGLDQLIDLVKAAADAASDERLSRDERELLIRQGHIFSSSVAELITILADHQDAHVREYRLHKLLEALGSTCVIANHQVIDTIYTIRNRLRAAPATAAKRESSQTTNDIIVEEASAVWQKRPSWKRHRVASEIEAPVNKRLKDQDIPALKRDAIFHRLKKLEKFARQDGPSIDRPAKFRTHG